MCICCALFGVLLYVWSRSPQLLYMCGKHEWLAAYIMYLGSGWFNESSHMYLPYLCLVVPKQPCTFGHVCLGFTSVILDPFSTSSNEPFASGCFAFLSTGERCLDNPTFLIHLFYYLCKIVLHHHCCIHYNKLPSKWPT
jgi:hypothetical protein